jgi:hypothetical protein
VTLAIDGSSPAVATQTNGATATVVSASFTPPANSVLEVCWSANTVTTSDPAAPSITDSLGTPLTYSQVQWKHRGDAGPTVDGQTAIWRADVGASPAAMTVTVTNGAASGFRHAALKVYVWTGQDAASPIGANGKSGSTSAASIAQSYTAQATGGQGTIVAADWDDKGAETAGTGCTVDGSADLAGQFTYCFARRTSADDVNTNSNTLNVTLPATSTNLSWVYVEIKAAAAATGTGQAPLTVPAAQRPKSAGTALVLGSAAASRDFQPPPDVIGAPPRAPGGIGSAVIVSSQAVSRDAQPPVLVVGAPPGAPGQRGNAVTVASAQAGPTDLQPPPDVIGAPIRPPATGSAQVVASRADPPTPTDSPPPATVVGAVRAPRPAGTVIGLASVAPSLDAQPAPLVVAAGVRPAPTATAAVSSSRADPVVAIDSPPRPQLSAGICLSGPGSALVVSSVAPSLDAQPGSVQVPARVLAVRRGAALVLGSIADPPPPTLPYATVVLAPQLPPRTGATVLSRGPVPPFVAPPGTPTAALLTIPSPSRRFAGPVLVYASTSCACVTQRPDTGVPGRPNTGTVTRPDTGIVRDPCC